MQSRSPDVRISMVTSELSPTIRFRGAVLQLVHDEGSARLIRDLQVRNMCLWNHSGRGGWVSE